MNICIFGDSVTWGAFLPFRAAWANLLRNYLEGQDSQIAVYDLGIDANTSTDLLNRFDTEAAARHPEFIIFAIGTNDAAYRDEPDNALTPINEFRANITDLFEKASHFTPNLLVIGLAKGDDSLTQPLPRSTTSKCYSRSNTQRYNDVLESLCKNRIVQFVDIFNLLTNEDFDDGLHPNLGGHQKIFEAVKEVLLEYSFSNKTRS